jgi:hypothetical protein
MNPTFSPRRLSIVAFFLCLSFLVKYRASTKQASPSVKEAKEDNTRQDKTNAEKRVKDSNVPSPAPCSLSTSVGSCVNSDDPERATHSRLQNIDSGEPGKVIVEVSANILALWSVDTVAQHFCCEVLSCHIVSLHFRNDTFHLTNPNSCPNPNPNP